MQPVQFGHEFSDEFVHVFNVVAIQLVLIRTWFAVRGAKNRAMDVGHRIVQKEGLLFVRGQELHNEFVHHVRHVLLVTQLFLLPIDSITRRLRGPIASAAGKDEILIETPLARPKGHLPPLPDARRDVSRFF